MASRFKHPWLIMAYVDGKFINGDVLQCGVGYGWDSYPPCLIGIPNSKRVLDMLEDEQ